MLSLSLSLWPKGLGGAAAFSPAALSPAIWLDPSDLTTLWQDTAATTPVTADGQSVARIDDKSGNGRHLTQATASARPLYKTAGGLHWLLFDGVDDYLAYSGAILTQPNIIYVAGTCTGGNTRFFDGPTGRQIMDFPAAPPGVCRMFAGSFLNGPSVDSSAHIFSGVFNGASSVLRADGVAGSTGNAGAINMEDLRLYIDAAATIAGGKFYGLLAQSGATVSSSMETWLGAKVGRAI